MIMYMKWIKNKRWALLKLGGILLLTVLLTAAWEHHVTVSIRRTVSERAAADDQQMWSVLCALSKSAGNYYCVSDEIYKKGSKISAKAAKTKDNNVKAKKNPIKIGVPPRKFAVAELRKHAAEYAGQLRRRAFCPLGRSACPTKPGRPLHRRIAPAQQSPPCPAAQRGSADRSCTGAPLARVGL